MFLLKAEREQGFIAALTHEPRKESTVTVRANLTVVHEVGLHARPASLFVKKASSFQSDIQISNTTAGKGPVDAKSILLILTLGVDQNSEIEISASGPDEQEAIEALTELIQNNFNED